MGSEPSRPQTPPQPSRFEPFRPQTPPTCFDTPWRNIPWANKDSALQEVKSYKPQAEGQLLRILLYGPSGAGKSSFINSVQSVLHGRIYAHALTKKYTTYKIPKGDRRTFYPFVFNDIMGLDPVKGVLVNDVKLAMMGHVKDGYTFNPEATLTDLKPNPFYNEQPADNDKVHVLVCVVPADTVSTQSKETVQKIREIRKEASNLGIPQVVIFTKIDFIPGMEDDLKKVYQVKYLREKMEEFSLEVGFPLNCIFPVKNYHGEIDLNNDVDSLILSSLKSIINFGDDCINFKIMGSEPSRPQTPPQRSGPIRRERRSRSSRFEPFSQETPPQPSRFEPFRPQTPPTCFDTPWRNIPWADKDSTLQEVKSYKPQAEGQLPRTLLYGPGGAGKSSFINSVQSVLHGRMYTHALADSGHQSCFTKKYTTYKIPKGSPKTFYPFVFNDIMGLGHHEGVLVNDVKLAMMGHVKDGYTFDPEATLTDLKPNPFYNEQPADNDKVHVLVCVVPANTVSTQREETVRKIWEIRKEASNLGIPQVVIFTKIDFIPGMEDDLKKVYQVKYLREKMEKFSLGVGFPLNCIFPVWNYHEEIDLNDDVDSLILSSLKTIINFGDDYINFKSQSEASDRYA